MPSLVRPTASLHTLLLDHPYCRTPRHTLLLDHPYCRIPDSVHVERPRPRSRRISTLKYASNSIQIRCYGRRSFLKKPELCSMEVGDGARLKNVDSISATRNTSLKRMAQRPKTRNALDNRNSRIGTKPSTDSAVPNDLTNLELMNSETFLVNLRRATGLNIVACMPPLSPSHSPQPSEVTIVSPSQSTQVSNGLPQQRINNSGGQTFVNGKQLVSKPATMTTNSSVVPFENHLKQSKRKANIASPLIETSKWTSEQPVFFRQRKELEKLATKETLARYANEEGWQTLVNLESQLGSCAKLIMELRKQVCEFEACITRARSKCKVLERTIAELTRKKQASETRGRNYETMCANYRNEKWKAVQIVKEAEIASCEALVEQYKMEASLMEKPDDSVRKEEFEKVKEFSKLQENRYKAIQADLGVLKGPREKTIKELKIALPSVKSQVQKYEMELHKCTEVKSRWEKMQSQWTFKIGAVNDVINETSAKSSALRREMLSNQLRIVDGIWTRKLEQAETDLGSEIVPYISWACADKALGFSKFSPQTMQMACPVEQPAVYSLSSSSPCSLSQASSHSDQLPSSAPWNNGIPVGSPPSSLTSQMLEVRHCKFAIGSSSTDAVESDSEVFIIGERRAKSTDSTVSKCHSLLQIPMLQ